MNIVEFRRINRVCMLGDFKEDPLSIMKKFMVKQ